MASAYYRTEKYILGEDYEILEVFIKNKNEKHIHNFAIANDHLGCCDDLLVSLKMEDPDDKWNGMQDCLSDLSAERDDEIYAYMNRI